MASTSENNKRIARNTCYMYIRMLITLVISLYTSREILAALGATDFGLYNVVGGVVVMCSFLSNSMSAASQRFFSYEIGRKNMLRLAELFSATFYLFLILALIVVIIAETLGLWFVCNKLNIPLERHSAALYVYHFSIISFTFSLIRIPYNALVISKEDMDFYAWTSIGESIAKLVIVFLLVQSSFDKLSYYAFLTLCVSIIVTSAYYIFCRTHYTECKLTRSNSKDRLQILSYSGWNIVGSLANVLMDQGVNILLNIFFCPAVNAARGIAYQVKAQVMGFVAGFQLATNPQIIKYYSANEFDHMKRLLFRSSRITFFLVVFFSFPVMLLIPQLLEWWLKEVPEYSIAFTRLVIMIVVVDSLSGNIIPAIQATGKIRNYQLGVGLTKLFNLPITYMLFKIGFSPEYAMIVSIGLNFLCLFVRLYELKRLCYIPIKEYLTEVVMKEVYVCAIGAIIPFILYQYLEQSLQTFFILGITSVISMSIVIFKLGLSKSERQQVTHLITKKLHLQ